jgi:hypothetical protein
LRYFLSHIRIKAACQSIFFKKWHYSPAGAAGLCILLNIWNLLPVKGFGKLRREIIERGAQTQKTPTRQSG